MSPWPWSDPGWHAVVLALALVVDRWLGEPPARFHPVVWMGTVIGWLRDRAPVGQWPGLLSGAVIALFLPLAFALLGLLVKVPWAGPALGVWLVTSGFAIRGLTQAGRDVADALDASDLGAGRAGLRSLCSRNPDELDTTQVAAAATESVAENSSDSLVAPLFWYCLAGVPGLLAYRCVNTLDAMVGYRGRFEWFGKASARLDDALNLIPARVTAGLLLALGGPGWRRGLRVLRSDHSKTESPNAGWPMAAIAGLLGVSLEKPGHYVLGSGLGDCDAGALRRGTHICERAMNATSWGLVSAMAIRALWELV